MNLLPLHFCVTSQASSAERLYQQGVLDYCDDDPWRITEEQLEYYTNQFKNLQPNLGALILGMEAPQFHLFIHRKISQTILPLR